MLSERACCGLGSFLLLTEKEPWPEERCASLCVLTGVIRWPEERCASLCVLTGAIRWPEERCASLCVLTGVILLFYFIFYPMAPHDLRVELMKHIEEKGCVDEWLVSEIEHAPCRRIAGSQDTHPTAL